MRRTFPLHATLTLATALVGPRVDAAFADPPAPTAQGDHDHAPRTVQYVANEGQWPSQVRFKASFPTSAMFLEGGGVTWSHLQADAPDLVHEYIQWPLERQRTFSLRGHSWRMRFIDADPTALVRGEQQRTEYHNYFIGPDRSRWAGNVPVFEGVYYQDLWPGIDLRWHGQGPNVEYDLLLDAGADADRISFRYEGLDDMVMNEQGDLVLRTSVTVLTEMKPVAWYADDHSPLACVFVLDGDVVRFRFPQGIDRSRPVVIDPVLVGATYSGTFGSSNFGHCGTFDAAGHIYGGAQNFGPGFPTTPGAFQSSFGAGVGTDIVVNKFSPDATTLICSTYLGGGSDDKPHSMIVNNANELCILGSSEGPGFPTTPGAFQGTHGGASDIVVVHLNSTFTELVGSTYLGGAQSDGRQMMTNNYGDTYRGEIMLDAAQNIFIASATASGDFPVTPGALQASLGGGQDGVITGLDPTCSNLVFSTFLGGDQDDNALGLRFDDLGGLYVCGGTASSDFPALAGGWQPTFQGGEKDGYIVRLAEDGGSLLASTFFGTTGDDMAYFIDLDNSDDVYIYGQNSGDLAINPPGTYGQDGGDIFIACFDPLLENNIFLSTLGTSESDWSLAPVAFLVDQCERIYISGYAPQGQWLPTPDAFPQDGDEGFHIECFDVNMTDQLFSSMFGGSHVDGGTSRFDKHGIVYQAVCSGGNSMPTTPDAFATENWVGWDLGIFKIDFEQDAVVVDVSASALVACVGTPITLSAYGDPTAFIWDLDDGTQLAGDTVVQHTYQASGTYTVMLVGTDSATCNISDTAYVVITVADANDLVASFSAEPSSSCSGYGVQLTNGSSGGTAWSWDLGDAGRSDEADPFVPLDGPGQYSFTLTVLDEVCLDSTSYTGIVDVPPATLELELASPVHICPGASAVLFAGNDYDAYLWSTSQTSSSISVQDPGDYSVIVTQGFCEGTDTITAWAVAPPPPMPDLATCLDVPVEMAATFSPQSITWNSGEQTANITTSVPGLHWYLATDALGCELADTANLSVAHPSGGAAAIPNVFSPNGDGWNDLFEVIGDIDSFSMEVHNRWGQLLYNSTNPRSGWNGCLDNRVTDKVPEGTYYYIIKYRDPCAVVPQVTRAGHVTLLR